MEKLKRYRKGQFEPTRKTCPKCKKKLKYDPNFPRYLASLLLAEEHGIKVPRRRIEGVARCCDSDWVKLN